MSNANILRLKVVAFPSDEVIARAIETLRLINTVFRSELTCGEGAIRPHISLYEFALPAANLPAAKEKVRLAAERKPIDLIMRSLAVHMDRYICWEVSGNTALSNMQSMLIGGLNQLRAGYLLEEYANLLTGEDDYDIGAEARRAIGECGYPFSRHLFHPYITLAGFSDLFTTESAMEGLQELPPIHFTVDKIFLVEADSPVSCGQVLAECDLKEVDVWEGNPPTTRQQGVRK